jgi:hypothetical protein
MNIEVYFLSNIKSNSVESLDRHKLHEFMPILAVNGNHIDVYLLFGHFR